MDPLHTDMQVLMDQQELIFNSSIQDTEYSPKDLPEVIEDRDKWW